jgi:hypothetical protein
MEVLAYASLSRYSCIIGTPHGGICTHRMSLYAPWVDQACRDPRCVSLQSPSDSRPTLFLRAKRPDCPALSALSCRRSTLYEVGAQTGANAHVVPGIAGVNTFLHPFLGIPLSPASLDLRRVAAQVFRLWVHRFMQDHQYQYKRSPCTPQRPLRLCFPFVPGERYQRLHAAN